MSFAANVLATWEYRRLLREKSELYEFLGAMRDITFDKSDTLVRALFQNTSISACDMEYHLQNQMYNMSRNSRHCNGVHYCPVHVLQFFTAPVRQNKCTIELTGNAASRPSLPCKFHEGLGVALLREDVNSRVVDLALMIVPAVLALLLIVFLLAQCLLLGGTPWDEEDDDI